MYYADGNLLSLLDLVGRTVLHPLLPSPFVVLVLALKGCFLDLVLDDLAHIVGKDMDGVLLFAVVTEVENLTNPFILDVLSRVVGVRPHGTEGNSSVIIVLDHEAVLLVAWVLLDTLDGV